MIEERFQVVDSNSVKLPGSCLTCGYGGSGRSFVDLGVQVKRYGRLYFCVGCFRECERVVNESIGNPTDSGTSKLGIDVSDDVPKLPAAKKPVGRPKGSATRTAKPNSK